MAKKSTETKPELTSKRTDYKYTNYFQSEGQLKNVNFDSDPEDILKAYGRLIYVYASNHVREMAELEDLIAEGQKGVCEAIKEFNNPNRKKRNYNFAQCCLYKIRANIYQYCLRNTTHIKTPYYIQRGCMHIAQIFKLMAKQNVAEQLLDRPGSATEQEVIDFIYDEEEVLPLKSMEFIRSQITKKGTAQDINQILSGILNHELGSRHSYIKNSLTDVGKVLQIKSKLVYSAKSNNMDYKRVVDLILLARNSTTELKEDLPTQKHIDMEKLVEIKELVRRGADLCGPENFDIFVSHKIYEKSIGEISKEKGIQKIKINEIVLMCTDLLKQDPVFLDKFLNR